MYVLITGAGGLCGPAVVEEVASSHVVRLTDVTDVDTHHEFVRGDISNPAFALQLMEGIDAVCHLARAPYRNRERDKQFVWDQYMINVLGTRNLLHAAVDAGVRRVVFASTVNVLSGYPRDCQVTETAEPWPGTEDYPLSKYLAERIFWAYTQSHQLECVVLRLFGVLARDLEGRKPTEAHRRQRDRLVERRDVARACRLALETEHLSTPFEIFHIVGDYPDGRWPCEKAKQMLGYKPEDNFPELWSESSD